MAYTFLKAKGYNIGKSILDSDSITFCQNILTNYPDKLILPVDSKVASSMDTTDIKLRNIEEMKDEDIGLDIGPKTIELFQKNLKDAKRVIMNGPMGLFENPNYSNGTKSIYDYLTQKNIKTLVGGGDSASSVKLLSNPEKFYHISTGGGATLEYLEGTPLPGISAIDEK